MNEILVALGRKGPRGLDALVEALEEEEKANEEILKKIRIGECFKVACNTLLSNNRRIVLGQPQPPSLSLQLQAFNVKYGACG